MFSSWRLDLEAKIHRTIEAMTASIRIPDRSGALSDPWSVPRGSTTFNPDIV